MRLRFSNNKLQRTCASKQVMVKTYGQIMAGKLALRLQDLEAAETLAELSHLPPARCHALSGDRAGQFSVDLTHPYRLIFAPDHEPVPEDEQGGVDRGKVTDIVILEVTDPHPRK